MRSTSCLVIKGKQKEQTAHEAQAEISRNGRLRFWFFHKSQLSETFGGVWFFPYFLGWFSHCTPAVTFQSVTLDSVCHNCSTEKSLALPGQQSFLQKCSDEQSCATSVFLCPSVPRTLQVRSIKCHGLVTPAVWRTSLPASAHVTSPSVSVVKRQKGTKGTLHP